VLKMANHTMTAERPARNPIASELAKLDRVDTIARYLHCLIGTVDESICTISEAASEGSASALASAAALDATAIALEYLAELERLSENLRSSAHEHGRSR
jgi:hypothetical protein